MGLYFYFFLDFIFQFLLHKKIWIFLGVFFVQQKNSKNSGQKNPKQDWKKDAFSLRKFTDTLTSAAKMEKKIRIFFGFRWTQLLYFLKETIYLCPSLTFSHNFFRKI